MLETIVQQIPYFMLVVIRITSFMLFVPFFNNQSFENIYKMGLAFLLSFLLFPTLDYSQWVIPGNVLSFLLAASQEMLIGILIGLTFMILLFSLQLAGVLLGFQMAFSMANAVDPSFEEDTNVMSVMMVMIGTLLFLNLRGDHYLLYALQKSFYMVAPGAITITRNLINELSVMIIKSFEVGFKLAAPAIILLLAIDVTLGLIGRTASKMQIFFVGLPLKIAIGLWSLTLILGFIVQIFGKEVEMLPRYIVHFFRLMKV